ncbi:MAG: PorP/SprF family type IX secretion system membrane protein [Bacteroidetes bacterium]|nr:PorP/SprF family type IX secretion system membrane protein [Bacteroidota bacterium]
MRMLFFKRHLLLIIICLLLNPFTKAQDIHFSQFYFNPTMLNPANIGVFKGDYRFTTNYKNQWQVVDDSYKTMFASAELALPAKRVGVGISFFNDKSGSAALKTNRVALGTSYTMRVSSNTSFYFGAEGAFGQKSISYNDNLKWDSQYNGNYYDPSLSSGELFGNQKKNYLDIGAGAAWSYINKFADFKSNAGLAVYHLNKPDISFYGTKEGNKLPAKIIANLNFQIRMGSGKNLFALPNLLLVRQGPFSEIIAGSMVKYIIGKDNASDLVYTDRTTSSAVMLGIHYRLRDAIIVNAAFELQKSLLLGFSYDVNVSKLRAATVFRGGLEVSLLYKGAFSN